MGKSFKTLFANLSSNLPYKIRKAIFVKLGICDKSQIIAHHIYFDKKL